NPNITMIIDFQSDRTKADGFVKHGINGIYNYTKIASDTFSLLLIACVVIYYVVQYFFREMKSHITFE
nr:6K2 [Blackberry virus Y]